MTDKYAFDVIIPARYGAQRLPGKPLADVAGKSLVQRVYECARLSSAERVVVATDDQRVADAVNAFDGRVVMTAPGHPSGTDRLHEVLDVLKVADDRIIVNLQGDEPLMPAVLIDQVASLLNHSDIASMATVSCPLHDKSEYHNPDVVKVVTNTRGEAMYFSRAPIPSYRERNAGGDLALVQRHIGLYAYRAGFIRKYTHYPVCDLEATEKLEQLRALWNGHIIICAEAIELPGPGVDNAADLARVCDFFQNRELNG